MLILWDYSLFYFFLWTTSIPKSILNSYTELQDNWFQRRILTGYQQLIS